MIGRSKHWMVPAVLWSCSALLGLPAAAQDPYARLARASQMRQQEQQRTGWYRATEYGPPAYESANDARRTSPSPAKHATAHAPRRTSGVSIGSASPAEGSPRRMPGRRPQAIAAQPYNEQDAYYEEDASYERTEFERARPSRVSRTAYDNPTPAPMTEYVYEDGPPGQWEGEYVPAPRGGRGGYEAFDDAYSAIDGTHYRSSYSTRCDGGCCENGCDSCDGCGSCFGPFASFLHGLGEAGAWVHADYLMWWMKGQALPPLVTTSPDETPRADAGVLGEPGTQIVFGNQRYLNEMRAGGRIEFGAYLDDCHTIGIGGGFFGLGEDTATYANASAGEPIIARPFFSTLTNAQDSALTAYSSTESGDIAAGTILASTSNDLINANAFLTKMIYRNCGVRWDALAGYRFTRFDEGLAISEFITVTETGSVVPRGTTFDALDSFDVVNRFNGGDLGLQFERCSGRWAWSGLLKVGLGSMYQEANIWGRTIVTAPGSAPDPREGDLLAMTSNIGSYSRNKFAFVPEARLNLSYLITPNWRVTVGYTFIYWSEVLRAGQLIDSTVNPTLIFPPVQGPQRPTFAWHDSDLWVQGLNFGTELRY
ncbi:MAG: BBP7 family outer membrane beta-barrel protein [Pirellulales bacterium]|nr:BBP7 family outer membrane beta-barrel protein [Pirellulales bacterium]